MASITVVLGAKILGEIPLTKTRLSVGRRRDADICLENVMISRDHAVIRQERGLWFVEDCSTKNGLLINGKTEKRCPLRGGDIIGIGKYSLTFNQSAEEYRKNREAVMRRMAEGRRNDSEFSLEDLEETGKKFIMDGGDTDRTITVTPGQLRSIRTQVNRRQKPHFESLSKNDRAPFVIQKSRLTIGKSDQADFRIPGGLTVAGEHAVLTQEEGRFLLQWIAGMSAVRVNERKIGKSAFPLEDGDVIRIGGEKLRFRRGLVL